MTHFNDFPLPEAIQHKLEALEFTTPTPIQEQAIPLLLQFLYLPKL
jgi:superfamily II DNA/RNA helicase